MKVRIVKFSDILKHNRFDAEYYIKKKLGKKLKWIKVLSVLSVMG